MPTRPAARSVDPVSIAAALLCGVTLGLGLGWLVHGNAAPATTVVAVPPAPAGLPAATPPAAPSPDVAVEAALARALEQAVRAAAPHGHLRAAVMLDRAPQPLVRPAAAGTALRTWSMIKAVTALTLLEQPGALRDPALTRFLEGALRRSDNCAQRKLTLELERRLGGGPAAVLSAIRSTVTRAGATINVAEAQRSTQGSPACAAPQYPARLSGTDASADVELLGTTRWRPADAVRFVHGLRATVFDPAAAGAVLALMAAPKLPSEEIGADARLSVAPPWGAGRTFAAPCWHLAYKAGWGGSNHGDFVAGQMGAVDLPGGRWVAFSVMFEPVVQPATDDPGRVHADSVIEQALTRVKSVLRRRFGSCA